MTIKEEEGFTRQESDQCIFRPKEVAVLVSLLGRRGERDSDCNGEPVNATDVAPAGS